MTNVHLKKEKKKLDFSFNITSYLLIWTFKSNKIQQINNVKVTVPFQSQGWAELQKVGILGARIPQSNLPSTGISRKSRLVG